jgi:Ca-activated chloride channel family protein
VVPPNSELDGTAIGAALTKAVQVLDASETESKVVVLLSDGRETMTEIPSADAAKLAADHGIKVHTIGLGHGQPTFGGFLPLDFSDLKLISKETGGQFFQARTDDDLQLVYERIDELEKVELDDPRYRTVDSFEWPLGVGLLLLVTGLLLEVLWIRGVP